MTDRTLILHLDAAEIAIVDRELATREIGFDTHGRFQQHEGDLHKPWPIRQRGGIVGEACALKYFGYPVSDVLTEGELDGGVDLIWPGKGWTVQVKTALKSSPRFAYIAEHSPLKAEILMQMGLEGPNSARVYGFISSRRFFEEAGPIKLGSQTYQGVQMHQLHQPTYPLPPTEGTMPPETEVKIYDNTPLIPHLKAIHAHSSAFGPHMMPAGVCPEVWGISEDAAKKARQIMYIAKLAKKNGDGCLELTGLGRTFIGESNGQYS